MPANYGSTRNSGRQSVFAKAAAKRTTATGGTAPVTSTYKPSTVSTQAGQASKSQLIQKGILQTPQQLTQQYGNQPRKYSEQPSVKVIQQQPPQQGYITTPTQSIDVKLQAQYAEREKQRVIQQRVIPQQKPDSRITAITGYKQSIDTSLIKKQLTYEQPNKTIAETLGIYDVAAEKAPQWIKEGSYIQGKGIVGKGGEIIPRGSPEYNQYLSAESKGLKLKVTQSQISPEISPNVKTWQEVRKNFETWDEKQPMYIIENPESIAANKKYFFTKEQSLKYIDKQIEKEKKAVEDYNKQAEEYKKSKEFSIEGLAKRTFEGAETGFAQGVGASGLPPPASIVVGGILGVTYAGSSAIGYTGGKIWEALAPEKSPLPEKLEIQLPSLFKDTKTEKGWKTEFVPRIKKTDITKALPPYQIAKTLTGKENELTFLGTRFGGGEIVDVSAQLVSAGYIFPKAFGAVAAKAVKPTTEISLKTQAEISHIGEEGKDISGRLYYKGVGEVRTPLGERIQFGIDKGTDVFGARATSYFAEGEVPITTKGQVTYGLKIDPDATVERYFISGKEEVIPIKTKYPQKIISDIGVSKVGKYYQFVDSSAAKSDLTKASERIVSYNLGTTKQTYFKGTPEIIGYKTEVHGGGMIAKVESEFIGEQLEPMFKNIARVERVKIEGYLPNIYTERAVIGKQYNPKFMQESDILSLRGKIKYFSEKETKAVDYFGKLKTKLEPTETGKYRGRIVGTYKAGELGDIRTNTYLKVKVSEGAMEKPEPQTLFGKKMEAPYKKIDLTKGLKYETLSEQLSKSQLQTISAAEEQSVLSGSGKQISKYLSQAERMTGKTVEGIARGASLKSISFPEFKEQPRTSQKLEIITGYDSKKILQQPTTKGYTKSTVKSITGTRNIYAEKLINQQKITPNVDTLRGIITNQKYSQAQSEAQKSLIGTLQQQKAITEIYAPVPAIGVIPLQPTIQKPIIFPMLPPSDFGSQKQRSFRQWKYSEWLNPVKMPSLFGGLERAARKERKALKHKHKKSKTITFKITKSKRR